MRSSKFITIASLALGSIAFCGCTDTGQNGSGSRSGTGTTAREAPTLPAAPPGAAAYPRPMATRGQTVLPPAPTPGQGLLAAVIPLPAPVRMATAAAAHPTDQEAAAQGRARAVAASPIVAPAEPDPTAAPALEAVVRVLAAADLALPAAALGPVAAVPAGVEVAEQAAAARAAVSNNGTSSTDQSPMILNQSHTA